MSTFEQYKQEIRDTLQEEQKALVSSTPHIAILSNGIRVRFYENRATYRIEIPDNFYFVAGMSVQCTIGSTLQTQFTFPAVVAEIRGQFLFLTFPVDMGENIPELHCTWNPSEIIQKLAERWASLQFNHIINHLLERQFPDNVQPRTKEPIFPSSFSDAQRSAVKQSISRKISVVIGERKRGKTGVAAALLFNALRDGKRILYLASTSESLHRCMNEVVHLNPAVAEESIAVVDLGLDLQPPLEMEYMTARGVVDGKVRENLQKLFRIIVAEQEYKAVAIMRERIGEKQKQIDEANEDAESSKQELEKLRNASLIERMTHRISKTMVDDAEYMHQGALSLLERLKQQVIVLTRELHKIEMTLPVSLKETKELEKFLSTSLTFTGEELFAPKIQEKKCLATTLSQALLLHPETLSQFDVVCVDDAHVLNLPEFFYCASLAKEQCFILADVTEQPPQSVSQLELARTWLQKNYFTYYQQSDSNNNRFTVHVLPDDVASELMLQDETPTIFESVLTATIEGSAPQKSSKGRIYFINTEQLHAKSLQYIGKKKILPFNDVHAPRVVGCIKHALMNGSTTQSDILIVTAPSGQSLYLREHLKANQFNNVEIASFGAIRLTTKRVVIFDLTVAGIDFTLRTLDDRKFGKVELADAFNTLLSTVTEDFYIIADLAHFYERYKGRFITSLLKIMSGISENIVAITNTARRFDDLAPGIKTKVLFASSREKQTNDYIAMLQQSKPSALETSQSSSQQTIAAAEKKLTADIRSSSLRVLSKREIINVISQYLESYPLYRSTAEISRAYSMLPDVGCDNENDFKDVMDMWNLLIYETSDVNSSKHPLAEKAKVNAKISSDLQQIHSYYHSDLEMVVEEGKHRLAQSIQKIFNDCIGKKPVTPTDWKNAYHVFLNRMEKYLDTIINQIRL